MSQNSTGTAPASMETSVRQLIANGKSRTALESAKEHHKAQRTAASEALLIDAYAARIQALLAQDLLIEAAALLELVRERYPSAIGRLEQLTASTAARAGSLDELLQPLNDPAITPERRAAIDHAIQRDVWDLQALADCPALPAEHPLRIGAAAISRAFTAVTKGPVGEDATALPEVSHRSPLASWKLLVRAIASLYRREDDLCRQYLQAIDADSRPARLVPAMQTMLDGKSGTPLNPSAVTLLSQTTGNPVALRKAVEALDQAFASGSEGRILQTVRAAVQECRQTLPQQLERLKQHIFAHCLIANIDRSSATSAMGGAPRHNTDYLRLSARALEATRDVEDLAVACGLWEEFRQQAIREGLFPANGAESAALYLHMAKLLQKMPADLLKALQHAARSQPKGGGGLDYLFPNILYQRAVGLDPHSEAFSQWMDWARRDAPRSTEKIAAAWHKMLPQDIEPVLVLMRAAGKRKVFPTALRYLAIAERIDGVHPDVRRARLHLLTRHALRFIQRDKPDRASEVVEEIAALPQAQQGDRPAFIEALRSLVCRARGRDGKAAFHLVEAARLLESSVASAMLFFAVAIAAKRSDLGQVSPVSAIAGGDRAALPAAVARVAVLAQDLNIDMSLPKEWFLEAEKQFPRTRKSLDTAQLRSLAEAALCAGLLEFAYAVTAAGLDRGSPDESRFLLLRARSLPEWQFQRRAVCASAAAELARQRRDMDLVNDAIQLLDGSPTSGSLSITTDEASDVLRKEIAAPQFPKGNARVPDYRSFFADKLCPCPDCRAERGEIDEPFSDLHWDDDVEDEFENIFNRADIPPDMPPEIARMLFEATTQAVLRGESIDDFMGQLGILPPGKRKKGRRR